MAVVSLSDVTFLYGDVPIVDRVSLNVPEGESFGLVGPNGSGKSTLLALILNLQHPTRGEMQLLDHPAYEFSDDKRIAYVVQDAMGATHDMPTTVHEVVRMGRYPRSLFGRSSAAGREVVAVAPDHVDIAGLADHRIGMLSSSQCQRVSVARALVVKADPLTLGELTVALNTGSREAFCGLLGDPNEQGTTVTLVEHSIDVVMTRTS